MNKEKNREVNLKIMSMKSFLNFRSSMKYEQRSVWKRFSTLYIIFLRHISCINIVFFVVCVYGRFIFVEKTGQVTQLISCVCMWLFGTTWTRQFHFFNRPLNVSKNQRNLVTHLWSCMLLHRLVKKREYLC